MNTFNKLFFVAISLSISINAFADCNDFVPGQVLIKFKQNQKTSNKANLKTQMKATALKTFPKLNVELWDFSANNKKTDIKAIIEQYKNHPDIEYIEPNYIYRIPDVIIDNTPIPNKSYKRLADAPNDPEFENQWYLHNTDNDVDINALEAWEITSRSPSVKVAILDSGIDWTHEDLIDNIWQNLGEDTNGNGVLIYDDNLRRWVFDPEDINGEDDDGNGYDDDFIGWDFINDNNNPMDDSEGSHGTKVAGIIGAVGNNNLGIAGISWEIEMAALKISGIQGFAGCDKIIEAVNYSVAMGFPISNNSWGGGNCDNGSQTLRDAIQNAQDNQQLFIAASGNRTPGKNIDINTHFPASYEFDNIISVTAITNFGELLISSNIGPQGVDIAAPGLAIRTTARNNSYGNFNQTSSAAPQVTAACALLKYLHPQFTPSQIKNAILNSATTTETLFDKVATGGRLNLNAALNSGNNPTPLCRIKDSLVLRTIYESMNGPNWVNPWNLNLQITLWNGVTLDNNECVSSLDLSSRNLSSSIPPDISKLSNIQSIRLSGNQISGNIPIDVGNINELKVLHINNNNLTGIIPSEIYLLNNLEDLNLSSNNLNGDIEPSISSLTNLIELKLNNNKLTGILPSEVGSLVNLNTLHLNDNDLGGNIPIELGDLDLEELKLQNNQFSGCYDSNLSPLCQFDNTRISNGNNFDATWNAFCQNNTGLCGACQGDDEAALIELYNATNGANWPNVNNRWNLNEPIENWKGVILDDNGCVIELNLGGFQTGGFIPNEIGDLSKLKVLKLWGNNLTGTIPSSIGSLTNLNELVLSSNNLTGNIPPSIGNLINLKELRLNSNNLSGNIPFGITNLVNLTIINLDNNGFTGSFPQGFSNLINLETLEVSNNNLSGNIPSEFGDLSELRRLILGFNSFSGSIPAELGNLCNLQFLGLNSNQLSGAIPPELGDLKSLFEFALDYNQLTGPIPFELCNLFEVFFVGLSNNNLSGIFPPCFSNLQNITTLALNNNELLSGCYDDDLLPLCGRLTSQLSMGNESISVGTNFNVPWEDFCNNSSGICDLVWPGDFNDDGRVTETDVLFWGLAHGNTGPSRSNPISVWIGQEADRWSQEVKTVNGRHQDANGNGQIEANDLQVLEANFGEIRTSDIQFSLNSSNIISAVRNYNNEDNAEYNLYIKKADGGTVETHGIALSLDFGKFKVDTVRVETSNSCIQPERVFEFLDTASNTFHLAITKTDKVNEICDSNTPFAKVFVIVNNVPTGGDALYKMDINGQSIKEDETLDGLGRISVDDVYPYPGSSSLFFSSLNVNHAQCKTLGSLTAIPINGEPPFNYLWNTGATTATISNLTPGYYQVEITDAAENSTFESAEIQGQFIPQYNENGTLITCDYSCPTLLTLDNNIQNGTYEAGSAISSKAQINPGNNVTFKAEDRIMLRNGFSVPANTTFNATIENCQ